MELLLFYRMLYEKHIILALDTTQSIMVIRFVIIMIKRLVHLTCCQSVIQ